MVSWYLDKLEDKRLFDEYIVLCPYIPCIFKAKFDKAYITLDPEFLNHLDFEVNNFDFNLLDGYCPCGVGGEWVLYRHSLVTLKANETSSNKLDIVDLALFELSGGWVWVIKNGSFTNDFYKNILDDEVHYGADILSLPLKLSSDSQ